MDSSSSVPSKRTIDDAMNAIINLQSKGTKLEKIASSRHQTIEIMKSYLSRLKIDTSSLSVVHVAGTKGKGSTCAMVESILRSKGYRTGLFTSPHLISVCERYRLNGKPVSEDLFLKHFWSVWDNLHDSIDLAGLFPPIAGFFRFLTLVALRLFLEAQVDVLILEVGLGGRLDATNIFEKPVVCGVTTLDLDHTRVLGDTIDKIAREKAGIFKNGIPVFSSKQEILAMCALHECAKETNAPLFVVPTLDAFGPLVSHISMNLQGNYQKTNAALAICLASTWLFRNKFIQEGLEIPQHSRDFTQMLDMDFITGLNSCEWPGRSQIVADQMHNATFYLDGAHTLKSMECCVEWFKQCCSERMNEADPPNQLRVLLFHCFHERDIIRVIQPLLQDSISFDYIIFSPADSNRPSVVQIPTSFELLEKAGIMISESELMSYTDENFEEGCASELQWQETLQAVWRCINGLNKTSPGYERIMVMPSIRKSIEFVQQLGYEEDTSRLCHVMTLVTGSLYLVGGALNALDYQV